MSNASLKSGELAIATFVVEEIRAGNAPLRMAVDELIKVTSELRQQVQAVKDRLAVGDERMQEHSDFIEDTRPLLAQIREKNKRRTQDPATGEFQKKKPPWLWIIVTASTAIVSIAATRIGGHLLTWVGHALQQP